MDALGLLKYVQSLDAPSDREKFNLDQQRYQLSQEQFALQQQKFLTERTNRQADELLKIGDQAVGLYKESDEATRPLYLKTINEVNEGLKTLRGFGGFLLPNTKEQVAMMDQSIKAIQWERSNGPLGAMPQANDSRYRLNDGSLNEYGYVTDLHQFNQRKRSFDGHVLGPSAQQDVPNTYELPSADVIKGANGQGDKVYPRVAMFDKGSQVPRIDNVMNLIGGPGIADGLGTTWQAIAANGYKHPIGTPTIVESNGRRYAIRNYLDFTRGGDPGSATEATDVRELNIPVDSGRDGIDPTVQSFALAYNTLGMVSPANDIHVEGARSVLKKASSLLEASAIAGAEDLREKLSEVLDNPAVATADGFWKKLWHRRLPGAILSALDWDNIKVQKAMQAVVTEHIAQDIQPLLPKGTVALFEPLAKGVKERWFLRKIMPFTSDYMPGPAGVGRINFVKVDGLEVLKDADNEDLTFWVSGDRVFTNYGQEIHGISLGQVASIVSGFDTKKMGLSKLFDALGIQQR